MHCKWVYTNLLAFHLTEVCGTGIKSVAYFECMVHYYDSSTIFFFSFLIELFYAYACLLLNHQDSVSLQTETLWSSYIFRRTNSHSISFGFRTAAIGVGRISWMYVHTHTSIYHVQFFETTITFLIKRKKIIRKIPCW